MDLTFWRGKTVLLTGHTGFKGSWLALWLQTLGAQVIGYSLAPPTTPNLFSLARVADHLTHIEGDICDLSRLQQVFNTHHPDIVIHMAAQSLVRYSYVNPVETYATNVMGTVHLLEAARQSHSVKVVVNVTSDKCYENQEWLWGYRETEPMGGYDPYSNSKGCAELITAAYRHSFLQAENKPALASARAGNVIGGGDWAFDRLVPDIMNGLLHKKNIIIRHPTSIRPWQHVLEPLSGYLLLAERLWTDGQAYASAWNLGPSEEDVKPVAWIVDYLVRRWGSGQWELDPDPTWHEARYLKLDCSKARTDLKWRPRWTLEKTLDAIIQWYQCYQSQADMQAVTLQQIKAYENDEQLPKKMAEVLL